MKKTIKILTIAAATAFFVSCGGGGKSTEAVCETEVACASKNCEDKLLDKFEKIADEYGKIAKQIVELANAGNHAQIVNLVSRQGELVEEWETIVLKVNEAYESGKFTEEQKARGEKIGEKFAAALGLAL